MLATAFYFAASAPGAGGIGFRPESGGSSSQILGVLLVTAAVLAVFLGVALFARSRGWLSRWQVAGAAGRSDAVERSVKVEQALRLSPRTTAFYVRAGGHLVLVIESTANVQVVPVEGGDD